MVFLLRKAFINHSHCLWFAAVLVGIMLGHSQDNGDPREDMKSHTTGNVKNACCIIHNILWSILKEFLTSTSMVIAGNNGFVVRKPNPTVLPQLILPFRLNEYCVNHIPSFPCLLLRVHDIQTLSKGFHDQNRRIGSTAGVSPRIYYSVFIVCIANLIPFVSAGKKKTTRPKLELKKNYLKSRSVLKTLDVVR